MSLLIVLVVTVLLPGTLEYEWANYRVWYEDDACTVVLGAVKVNPEPATGNCEEVYTGLWEKVYCNQESEEMQHHYFTDVGCTIERTGSYTWVNESFYDTGCEDAGYSGEGWQTMNCELPVGLDMNDDKWIRWIENGVDDSCNSPMNDIWWIRDYCHRLLPFDGTFSELSCTSTGVDKEQHYTGGCGTSVMRNVDYELGVTCSQFGNDYVQPVKCAYVPSCDPDCINGNCTIGSPDDYCECFGTDLWEGNACQTPVCSPVCDHGTCEVLEADSSHYCDCDDGWEGTQCNEAVGGGDDTEPTSGAVFNVIGVFWMILAGVLLF